MAIEPTPKECFVAGLSVYKTTLVTGLNRGQIQRWFHIFKTEEAIIRTRANPGIVIATKMERELLDLIESSRDIMTLELSEKIKYKTLMFAKFCA